MHSAFFSEDDLPHRILVVEDDSQILATVASLLEDEGYEVQAASNGRQALDLLREGPIPDLIILDLMMPEVDGWEFRTIQRADASVAGIPVLAISASDSPRAAAIHATSFLKKPFGVDELLYRVQKIIDDQVKMEMRLCETERLASLGTLAAGATHGLDAPLAGVASGLAGVEPLIEGLRGVLAGLAGAGAPAASGTLVPRGQALLDDVQNLLRDARNGTEWVTGAVRALQNATRRNDGPFRPVDLRTVLQSAIALTAHELRPHARVVAELPPLLPPIHGNEVRLGQLFMNLLINAGQAIPEGSAEANEVRVDVRCPGRGVVVEIKDTGVGMSPAVRKRLFEPFFTTRPPGQGAGLGLPICLGIAREHQGWIEVESEPGRGSVVRVILPAADQDPLPVQAAADRTRPSNDVASC
jgi:signal transduction histidine kinase